MARKDPNLAHCLVTILSLAAMSSTGCLAAPVHNASVVPLDVQFGSPPAPIQANDRDHLLYEMRLTNFAGRDVTIAAIEVFNADSGAPLANLTGEELEGMIATPGRNRSGTDRLTIAPGSIAVIYFDTIVTRGTATGLKLGHRVQVVPAPGTPADETRTLLETKPLPVSDAGALIVDAPLRGGDWLAANALSNNADHRRTIAVIDGQARIAQRYAIDFVKLDATGRAFSGDPARNRDWAGFGEPVLAVADGVVEIVKDGLPDNQPLAPPSIRIGLDTIAGNNVTLSLPGGQRVLYGHLKAGSIVVKEGQVVRQGDVLAALGNSGQSDAPHLHIHVADGASALGADGLPFAFRRTWIVGHVPSLDVLEDPDGWKHSALPDRDSRQGELPTDLTVVAFP